MIGITVRDVVTLFVRAGLFVESPQLHNLKNSCSGRNVFSIIQAQTVVPRMCGWSSWLSWGTLFEWHYIADTRLWQGDSPVPCGYALWSNAGQSSSWMCPPTYASVCMQESVCPRTEWLHRCSIGKRYSGYDKDPIKRA